MIINHLPGAVLIEKIVEIIRERVLFKGRLRKLAEEVLDVAIAGRSSPFLLDMEIDAGLCVPEAHCNNIQSDGKESDLR